MVAPNYDCYGAGTRHCPYIIMPHTSPTQTATLAIENAIVFTADDLQTFASAVAIIDNIIVYVGDQAGLQPFVGEDTRVIDAKGKVLVPGFIDSHFHLAWGSQTLIGAQLYEVNTMSELESALLDWHDTHQAMPWILGQGLSYKLPTKDTPLTRHYLDKISPDKPLALTTYDMHSMFVNSAALKAMGLERGVKEPLANGEVVVDDSGLATGELYEPDAMDFVYKALPEPTPEQWFDIIGRGLKLMAEQGITSVHNMDGDFNQAKLYAALAEQELLSARVYIPFWVKPGMTIEHMLGEAGRMRDQFNSNRVRSNCVKFFMDGVYESHTAVALEGYPDQPDNYGEPIWDTVSFETFAGAADKAGFQIFVHACGDGAVRRVLDGYEQAQQTNGVRDSRHRVEHIEMIAPSDVPRFEQLGVIASMQPLHAPLKENDPDVWTSRVAQSAWDRAFAWNILRNSGAVLAFGSDWPVAPANAILGIYGACNRQALRYGGVSHAQSLSQALLAYTRDAAYAEFQEDVKGQIKVRYWADMVLLSEDVFSLPTNELERVSVDMTICDGRIVFERGVTC